ncbi:MAG: hypothetical protein IT206_06050 [Fimbriimonadaceae bacterium]|nr:hypothetical protein [Fimbriimonadaceae bacterium]
MAESAGKVCKALKLKAQPKSNVLSIKHGLRKFTLPYEARVLTSEKYIFVHVLPEAKIFRFEKEGLVEVTDMTEAKTAQVSFRTRRKGSRRQAAKALDVPDELKAALSKIPAGYKIAVDRAGQVRMVKARPRKK